jgi:hypothetical protein
MKRLVKAILGLLFILFMVIQNYGQDDVFVNSCIKECKSKPAKIRYGMVDGRKFDQCKSDNIRSTIDYASQMDYAKKTLWSLCPKAANKYFK